MGQVCDYYNWTNIAVICDDDATESNFYALMCKTLESALFNTTNVQHMIYAFHYKLGPKTINRIPYETVLAEASKVSRGA